MFSLTGTCHRDQSLGWPWRTENRHERLDLWLFAGTLRVDNTLVEILSVSRFLPSMAIGVWAMVWLCHLVPARFRVRHATGLAVVIGSLWISQPAQAQFGPPGAVAFQPTIGSVLDGAALNVTPVVSADRRYVRLGVNPYFNAVEGFNTVVVPAAVGGGGGFGGFGGGFGGRAGGGVLGGGGGFRIMGSGALGPQANLGNPENRFAGSNPEPLSQAYVQASQPNQEQAPSMTQQQPEPAEVVRAGAPGRRARRLSVQPQRKVRQP